MKKILAVAFVTLGLVSAAYAGGQGLFRISATQSEKTGNRVENRDARIYTSSNSIISADSATYTENASNSKLPPYLVELQGAIDIYVPNGHLSVTGAARYYPELDTVVADKVSLQRSLDRFMGLGSSIGCSAGGNQVQVTFSNGMVITADTYCNGSGSYTCSNHVLHNRAGSC